MKINLTLSRELAQMLDEMGINPIEYGKTAYGGESAGLDLYNTGPEVVMDNHHMWTAFGEKPVMIPTGVFLALPENTVSFIKERGSITKTALIVRAGVIDPGYTGEIFVNFVNLGSRKVTIPHGAKLPAQIVTVPCFSNYEAIGTKEYIELTQKSKREKGSLGSSDIQQG